MSIYKKEDPRAIRSKRMLKNAVFSLITEDLDISQLTVQKIAKRAELNRATFYLHYEDINDLLRQIVHEIFDDLSMKIDPLLQGKSSNEQETLVTFLNYFYEYRKILAVLFENKGFKKHMFNLLINTIEKRRNTREIQYTREVVSIDIIASSLLGIIMWWIKDGTQFSSEYIADQISLMYKKGMENVLIEFPQRKQRYSREP
ncbi:TetR/AcrR family transcriptional regulator C-terminal domain-containing protein [Paenibacillus sp. D2_2]|uniref:TetR/AcrR family transcriptional regulator n=1 Tax=Paenibacillus sp. D2_2 TaxID=3073092 RepID=UPI0028157486|nr:TetR/AcrR family transcriptional regulator C-terminal domain-containing protein [Paenibacillus sp. D2_2]WMT40948.1 TetR/AcrR family transcriptional regulator C-terminal domain-containing protein [Paenibacillus sp. D2_2]